jgi:hypothetical protein
VSSSAVLTFKVSYFLDLLLFANCRFPQAHQPAIIYQHAKKGFAGRAKSRKALNRDRISSDGPIVQLKTLPIYDAGVFVVAKKPMSSGNERDERQAASCAA